VSPDGESRNPRLAVRAQNSTTASMEEAVGPPAASGGTNRMRQSELDRGSDSAGFAAAQNDAATAQDSTPSTRKRGGRVAAKRRLLRLLSPLAAIAVWEVLTDTGVIDRVFLSPPHEIATAMWQLTRDGELLPDVAATLGRLAGGYALGAGLGLLLGCLMGRIRIIENLVDPLLQAMRPVSPIALLPASLIFLGIGYKQKLFIMSYSVFFPVVINTYYGVRGVEPVLIRAARTLGARSEAQIMRTVVLPAAMPTIFAGLRIGLGIAFVVVVAAEMVAASSGIGYMIIEAERSFHIVAMYAGIVVISILGTLADRIFLYVRGRALKWSEPD
jgi:ABC-type nitrate/sulfonate/bicarbonate transport system permease component